TPGCGVKGTVRPSERLDRTELKLYRSGATESQDCDLNSALLIIDFVDHAIEVGKRTINNTNRFARLEQGLGLGLVATISHTTQDGFRLTIGDGGRLVRRTTNEAHHARRVLHEVPGGLAHFHLHQDIAREELALALAFLAIAHFHHFFGGNEDLAKKILHAGQLDTLDQRAHDMLFVTRISMHDIPTLSHVAPLTDNQRNKPAEQGIKPPQQQRHHKNNSNHDQSGLRGLLTGRP